VNYRPITDLVIPARPKLKGGHKYYGAYPAGLLERARALLGVRITEPVLHVCAGMTRHYPYPRFAVGPNDRMLDLDPALDPDYLQDAREPYPPGFVAVMADPPYSEDEAGNYKPGSKLYPTPAIIVRRAFEVLPVGGRVGVLHFKSPRPPSNARLVAVLAVWMGYDMAMRSYTVFEKADGPVKEPRRRRQRTLL
jgi:hypothetical protein